MIIAFDLTNRRTFENVQTWIASIYRLAPDSTIPKVLVGNKVDLEGRVVTRSEAQRLADDHGIEYFETSAKENVNVQELMQHIFGLVYDSVVKKEPGTESIVIGGVEKTEQGSMCNLSC